MRGVSDAIYAEAPEGSDYQNSIYYGSDIEKREFKEREQARAQNQQPTFDSVFHDTFTDE